MNLTKEQQDIVDNCDKNIYISAAPGSGKSTVLSLICEKLLGDENNSVLLVTFTNAAARSILNKCNNLDPDRITGGTFHGIAYRILKENGVTASICDEHKKRLIIKTIFNCKKDKKKFEDIYDHISTSKSTYPVEQSSELSRYQEELEKYDLLDFDDIIIKFIEISRASRTWKSKSITHILVDELQDTSSPQFYMLQEIKNKGECKNNHLPAQKGIPDVSEFLIELLEIFCVARNFNFE